ncbi:MAG: GHKL domain-containing protein [Clostridiales bacterium]
MKTYYDRFDKKIKQQEMAVMEHQLQMQYEYFLSLDANRTEFQKLRHDTANHLQTLNLMLKTKNIDQADEYLDELCGSYKENLSVKLSPNMPTNAVLINKKHLCEENKIAFECDIRLDKDIGISDVDMVSAVANIMDNAIEACKRQPDGEEKFLKFYAVLQKGCLVLEAKNSCNKDEKLLNVGDTSKHKKSDHGFGLAIIKDIADRYDGDFKITAENGIVTASLLLFPQLKVGE